MDQSFFIPLYTSFKLACTATSLLFFIALPLSYGLVYKNFFGKALIEAITSLPIVLPPSVIGYYILMVYSPQSSLGAFLNDWCNVRLAFSFTGILIATVICGLPFMLQPILAGLRALPSSLREAAYTLGKSPLQTFVYVLLPCIRPSIISALVLTFAHCLGEFGVVLMVGGNIPGETRVASIAIYDELQGLNYNAANTYSIILFLIAAVLLTIVNVVNHKKLWMSS